MRFLLSSILFCVLTADSSNADMVMTLWRIGVSVDYPRMEACNTGELPIMEFHLTIGDESKNFDSSNLLVVDPDLSLTLQSPDDVNDFIRSDVLSWSCDGFVDDVAFTAKIDIDSDDGPATVDWQTTLFNNGDTPNAVLSATWGNGMVTSIILPDDLERNPFAPYHIVLAEPVPEPATLLLLVSGLGLLFSRRSI